MSVTRHTNILLELHCDAKNKCAFREPLNDKDWGGHMWGGFDGKTEEEVMQKAKKRGWLIEGGKAICPDCNPTTHIQLPKVVTKSGCHMPGCEIECQGGPDFDNDPLAGD